jgi:hypothetical protein
MSKILFLDHDGVICLSNNWGGRHKKQRKFGRKMSQSTMELPVEYRFDNFDNEAVVVLNKILTETDAEIVVSSDWKRWATVEEMGEYYESKGIIKKPIAFTKFLKECDVPQNFPWSRTYDLEQSRSLEIKQYLQEHPETTHWVAVDDLHMGVHVENSSYGEFDRDWGLSNFVWTPSSQEGIKQTGVKDKIIKFLNKNI